MSNETRDLNEEANEKNDWTNADLGCKEKKGNAGKGKISGY